MALRSRFRVAAIIYVGGGMKGAAVKLGLPRQTLESKIKALGINKFRFRRP